MGRDLSARLRLPVWISNSRHHTAATQSPNTKQCLTPLILGMDFYELRHFCATHLLELGVSHADVAVQLGHTDGGALVMSTYGHPSEDGARERLKRAFVATVVPLAGLRQSGAGGGLA